MTEPKKPSRARKPAAKTGATQSNNKTALGQTITDGKTTGRRGFSDEIKAAAKALWEGDINATYESVAEELGITLRAVRRFSSTGNWSKRKGDMSERAHAAADTYTGKLAELGPEITTDQQKQVEADAAEETAVQLRAKVLERHRKELNVPRVLVQEAVQARSFDKAKLAKITSETLKILQDAERKAWGIDSGPDGQTKVQVVIERE